MADLPPPLATPVLLLIFNRPSLTIQTFERLRAARPARLFIAGDGPRQHHPEDFEAIEQAREVVDLVDWDCEVKTLFRDQNLGCARAVSSAINWAFDSVDELIVLEDDCLPGESFFPYCTELLERYRDDHRIFVISGDNFQQDPPRTPYSYYFSRFNHCWGWATWKRAWRYFDFEMREWPEIRAGSWLTDILQDRAAEKYWTGIFDSVYAGKIDSWAYRWTFSCWAQSGLTALPTINLVQNIGFGEDATHTVTDAGHSIRASELKFPISHPPFLCRDARADAWTQEHHFNPAPKWARLYGLRNWLWPNKH
jgi:GT2 family glycosyltransferase